MSAGKKILLIEDEPDFRFGVRMQLEANGYAVIEAEDGVAGLDAAREQSPDLIILDGRLPKMGGYEVARQLKGNQKYRAIPIVMLTARSQQSDKQTSQDAGADAYLTKPFDSDELVLTISKLLPR